jgi:hypothetical protein
MKYAVKIGSRGMIYLPSVINVGIDVQAILKFCLRNFVGIIYGNFELSR